MARDHEYVVGVARVLKVVRGGLGPDPFSGLRMPDPLRCIMAKGSKKLVTTAKVASRN
jgi:hypothetical protein